MSARVGVVALDRDKRLHLIRKSLVGPLPVVGVLDEVLRGIDRLLEFFEEGLCLGIRGGVELLSPHLGEGEDREPHALLGMGEFRLAGMGLHPDHGVEISTIGGCSHDGWREHHIQENLMRRERPSRPLRKQKRGDEEKKNEK